MTQFSFNQLIYATLIAIAGEDDDVTKHEAKRINKVFDHFLTLSSSDKKAVLKEWKTTNGEKFTEMVVDLLKKYPKNDQLEAYMRVSQFINYSKTELEKSGKAVVKDGVDITRIEIQHYWEKANQVREAIGVTTQEYATFIKKK